MTRPAVVSIKAIRIVIATMAVVCCVALPAHAQLLESISDTVDAVKAKVTDIQTKVNGIKSDVSDSAEQLAAGLQTLSKDVRDEISASLGEINEGIQDLKAERAAFNANAGVFKGDLIGMLSNLESLSGEISRYTGLPVTYEFATERALIGGLPDRAMAPMYASLAGENAAAFTSFVGDLSAATGFIHQLNQLTTCPAMVADPDRIEEAASAVRKLGGATKLVGKGLMALGATGVSGKPVQVGGFAGVLIESNRKKKWGERLDGISELMMHMASLAQERLLYCTVVNRTDRILDALSNLNVDLTNLDTPVSTRASQSSVDAVGHSVQLALDSVGHLGDDHALMLRLQVEDALAHDTKGIALFSRPESHRGLLDLVRDIAQDTIVQQQALQGPIVKAWDWLWQGDRAVATGDFPKAYDLYGKAYRTAAR
jgi:hypothetical protein